MKCPKCGDELTPRKFIETWDPDGTPDEVYTYPVCERCKVAWEAMDIETMEPYKGERRRIR